MFHLLSSLIFNFMIYEFDENGQMDRGNEHLKFLALIITIGF